MTLKIGTQYTPQFQEFVNFANPPNGVKDKTIARVNTTGANLKTRTIMVSQHDGVGVFSALFRKQENKTANDQTRELFRKSIADIFDGEEHIPDSVRDAMKFEDYGKGKPLTARRIREVKVAIDNWNSVNFFAGQAEVAAARSFGYTDKEMKQINVAANLYMKATGCTQAQALHEVMTPQTPANRLMQYGGRFLLSEASFKQGLKLIDEFKDWFMDVKQQLDDKHCTSLSAINVKASSIFAPNHLGGFERFVFEELAVNPKINLNGSPEDVFGMKNNPASRFLGRYCYESQAATLMNMPPASRGVIYDAFACLLPMVNSAQDHKPDLSYMSIIGKRIIKNYDAVKQLRDNGNLTPKTLFATCFSEIQPQPENVNTLTFSDTIYSFFERGLMEFGNGTAIILKIEASGCTYAEAAAAQKAGVGIPAGPYTSMYNCELSGLNGTFDYAMSKVAEDIVRPEPYRQGGKAITDTPTNTFNFPNSSPITTSSPADAVKVNDIRDSLIQLCGNAHPRQINSLLFGLTQQAKSPVFHGLLAFNIESSEHVPINYNITRDATTGSVTIQYTNPPDLPISFSWTATVDINGATTTTPIQVTVPQGN